MGYKQTNAPESCSDMGEIRAEIDALDREVIQLLSQRFAYVKSAARFKKNPDQVQAKARFESMLAQRRTWAENAELNPDVIEKMYRDLVTWFIAEEMAHWSQSPNAS
ncbi:isochorismate lyase [Brenneria izadpanahii]|uniref:chorismate mutase n=1 Tax=Brenneria izadpanahii TaxID=2722756 RepID=A0ABX7URB1_9GAMM|nr:isochorismate lyase [Brenneria izadpanahii]QTF08271.1 isochorismate lyase [Brenneria izadpanahii]